MSLYDCKQQISCWEAKSRAAANISIVLQNNKHNYSDTSANEDNSFCNHIR